ncbi:MAG: YdcF family protein, partial [Steroidobacter sp.]
MILGVLLLMVAIATVLIRFGFKRTSRVLYVLAALAFLFAGTGIPANILLGRLQNELPVRTEAWGDHNVIILLGAGSEMTDQGP